MYAGLGDNCRLRRVFSAAVLPASLHGAPSVCSPPPAAAHSQVCNHPTCYDPSHERSLELSGKCGLLMDLVQPILDAGEKARRGGGRGLPHLAECVSGGCCCVF